MCWYVKQDLKSKSIRGVYNVELLRETAVVPRNRACDECWQRQSQEDNTLAKYWDFLVPKTTIGCKCRVIGTASLPVYTVILLSLSTETRLGILRTKR